jgi:hypothetical protein
MNRPSHVCTHGCVISVTSYLNAPHAQSRIGGHHYLATAPPRADINNGAILNPSSVLKVVISSAAEAKYAALFKNGKAGILERTIPLRS